MTTMMMITSEMTPTRPSTPPPPTTPLMRRASALAPTASVTTAATMKPVMPVTPTGTGSGPQTAYATHLVRMSHAMRSLTEKADTPVIQCIKNLREEITATMMTAGVAYDMNEPHTAMLKQHLDTLAFDASVLGASFRQSVRSLSDELERAAQCIVKSEARVTALTQRFEARGREVVVLRRALARAQQQVAHHQKKKHANYATTTFPVVDADEDAYADTNVDYKRQCAVLHADLEDQRKTHARAISRALQRTMAMETLLAQARATMAEAASAASTTATVDAPTAAEEDVSADENATTTSSSDTTTNMISTTLQEAAASTSQSPAQEPSSVDFVDAAIPAARFPDEETSDGAVVTAPLSPVPPRTTTRIPQPSRIVPPKTQVPRSLVRSSFQTILPSTGASCRRLRSPGWALANVASASATSAPASSAVPRTGAAATASPPATASSTPHRQQKKPRTMTKPKQKSSGATAPQGRRHWH